MTRSTGVGPVATPAGALEHTQLDEACELLRQRLVSELKERPDVPSCWTDGSVDFAPMIGRWIDAGRAVALTESDGGSRRLLGWAAYDTFMFHGDRAGFVPVVAHACVPDASLKPRRIHQALYAGMAQRWISAGILAHHVSLLATETDLVDEYFGLGFGMYVVDGFRDVSPVSGRPLPPDVTVDQATTTDEAELSLLIDETDRYYPSSPIFLVRDGHEPAALRAQLSDDRQAIFVARRNGRMIGFMYIGFAEETEPIMLTDPGCAVIDNPGAYLVPEERGGGVGRHLLAACVEWFASRKGQRIHVDFESANLCAAAFWPRHFKPTILSMKRGVNRDAAEEH